MAELLLDKSSLFSSITPTFDLGVTSTIQQNSLVNINQDLNGNVGPLFDLGIESTIHNPDSLFALNSPGAPDQDLNGNQGPNFDLGPDSNLHQNSLLSVEQQYQSQVDLLSLPTALSLNGNQGPNFDDGPSSTLQQNSLPDIPDTNSTQNSPYQDLNGVDGGQGHFHDIPNPGMYQGKQVGGVDLHEHLLQGTYSYQHGNKPEVIINAGKQDLNGAMGPIFNKGKEANQDPESPVFDTIHENSLLRKFKDPNRMDLDLDGDKGFFQRPKDVTDTINLMSLNQVPNSPSDYADVNGINRVQPKAPDGASIPNPQGYFHGIPNPTVYQGKQAGGVDLHEFLLSETYAYKYGNSMETILGDKNATTFGGTLDLNIDVSTETPSKYLDSFNSL